MFKFIHAADLHLDSALKGLERYEGAPVDEIREAARSALKNLVELAVCESVGFVVIAGDIYDGDWKHHNTGMFFLSQMNRLREAGIPVIVISGNHDAANKMTRTLNLPDNVQMLSHKQPETATCARLDELGVAIHGRSFAKAAETDNLARDYPPKVPGLFNIGLLHTSLEGSSEHATYAPCTLDDLLQKDYDYWALGHVHNRAIVHDSPPIVFSGNLQGRHIRETGAKGCYLVTVDDRHQCSLEFRPLDVFRWETCCTDLSDIEQPEEMLTRFSAALALVVDRHPDMPLGVRVMLTGKCAAHQQLLADQERWTSEIHASALVASSGKVWVEKVCYQTRPKRNADTELMGDGPIGEIVSYLQELATDEKQLEGIAQELADLRRKLPNELIQGEDNLGLDSSDGMRQYLADVEQILLSRLMEDAPS